jgi:sigma-B regulation protein RsbU (phosphoserine phosphatase)
MHKERGLALGLSSLHPSHDRIHSRIRIVVVIGAVGLVVLELFLALRIPEHPYDGVIFNNLTVARIAPGSPGETAGISKGDQLLSVNGAPCVNPTSVSDCLVGARPGDTVTYGILREGRELTVRVTLASLPPPEIVRKISIMAVGLSFIAMGLLVYFRRNDKVALVFYLFSLAFGLALTNIVTVGVGSASPIHRYVLNDLLMLVLPALFLHFFLIFPEKRGVLKRFRGVETALYAPAAVMFVASVYFNVMIFSRGMVLGRAVTIFRNATAAYFIAFLLMGLVAFIYAYRHVATESMRSKLRLVVWGTLVGTLPLVFVQLVVSIRPEIEIPGEKLAFLPLILVPVAFGHAIVRYGLLDLEIVVKRSLVYTLLIAVLASVYFVVVYGIGRLASSFVGSADLLFSIISIFVITLLISPLKTRIRIAVDKLFFRQEYNYRKVLKQISHSLAGIINLESLISYLAIRVAEVLDASTVVVFLLDERTAQYTSRYGVRAKHTMLKGFAKDGTLSTYLAGTQTAFNVERTMASGRRLPLIKEEAMVLLDVDAAVVVPFVFKSELLGFISIGRKRSDEFFSATDVELLETLCDQVSLAIENANLYLEAVEKQKMERELEVAREIQHRLLPKALPEIPGLVTHAMNIPSKHVGGDYYDLIPLSRDKVALAIADVSGKGVPAALLMASLQSSLRAEADPAKPPSEVISALNRVIYEHTGGGTFVTIFYGIIDFTDSSITYCNAGQSPPILLFENAPPRQLDNTDIVIGIDPAVPYRDTTVPIREGELLFLYTDGITDELNEADEPYGEARLVSELLDLRKADLPEIVSRVHDDVLRFTDGKPQDDLTVLAVRVLAMAPFGRRSPLRRKT